MDPQSHRFGVYFPEANHPGYLLVRYLASGAYGRTILVLSLADGNLYVRKIDIVALERTPDAIQAAEYTVHGSFRPGSVAIRTASTWEFCNGGTFLNLINSTHFTTAQVLTDNGYPNITPGLPEAFIWSFFDTVLAVLISSHRAGVAHNDLNDSNIYLHWPLPTSNLPDVYIGDWGLSQEYPWRAHPNPYFSTPYHLNNLSDLQRPQLQYMRGIRTNLFQHRMAPIEPQPAGFDPAHVLNWYSLCRQDFTDAASHLYTCIVSPPQPEIMLPDEILEASRQNRGVNGYSKELINAYAVFVNLIHRFDTDFRPAHAMRELVRLHNDVQILRGRADQLAAADGSDRANVLGFLQPPHPIARPELWPTHDSITFAEGGNTAIIPQDEEWTIQLDPDQFQIRRVQRDFDGTWGVEPVGRWSVGLVDNSWTIIDHDGLALPTQSRIQDAPRQTISWDVEDLEELLGLPRGSTAQSQGQQQQQDPPSEEDQLQQQQQDGRPTETDNLFD